MRRSDAKQVRRRLACTVLRVTASLRDIERRLNVTFAAAQKFEAGIAEFGVCMVLNALIHLFQPPTRDSEEER